MNESLEPLSEALRVVLRSAAPAKPPPGALERVRGHLEASAAHVAGAAVAGAPGPTPGAAGGAAPVSAVAKLLGTLGLPALVVAAVGGGVAGAVLHATLAAQHVVVMPAPAPRVEAVAPAGEVRPEPTPMTRPAVPSPHPAQLPRPAEVREPLVAPTAPTAPPSDPDAELAQEQQLLETARAALVRDDGSGALDALAAHARRFPSGRLTEEREALRIEALVVSGRRDAASAEVQKFHARYPQSLLGPAVDEAVR